MGGSTLTWPVARLLPQGGRAPRATYRRRRHSPEARDDHLAYADEAGGLHLGTPALLARKLRSVELRAGCPAKHAKRGAAYDYNIPARRAEERRRVEEAEAAYANFTAKWRIKTRPKKQKPVENLA